MSLGTNPSMLGGAHIPQGSFPNVICPKQLVTKGFSGHNIKTKKHIRCIQDRKTTLGCIWPQLGINSQVTLQEQDLERSDWRQ